MTTVLQPVRRRRRRRNTYLKRRVVGVVVIACLAMAIAWLVTSLRPSAGGSATVVQPKVAPAVAHQAAKPVAPMQLLTGQPFAHAFAPTLGAKAAIVIEASTGRILWEQNSHARLPIASLTKIMTAQLVLQHLPLSTVVNIGPSVPRVPLVREGLRSGEQVPAAKLLDSLLMYSGNDDALALAIATAGTRASFLKLMNREARRLGLSDSHFTSTSGVIDDGNYSTAADLAALTRYAMGDSRFRKVVRTRIKHVPWAAPTYAKTYVNKNRFLWLYPGAIGVKTGWTTLSGPCVVEAATRHGVTLIAVALNSPRQYNDAARLLNYGYSVVGLPAPATPQPASVEQASLSKS